MPVTASSTREVGVVFKTHLDIGFTDLASRVLRSYLRDYIPAALELARRTRHQPHRFVWTTGSWLAWRYLEDAPASGRRRMEEAIAEGDFHWHALPFTAHAELMDASLFRLGLSYSQRLDQRFGRSTRAAKLTDVPGHTIGIVPLLAEAGVRLLHIGVNPASTVPTVPPVFRWRCGRHEIVVIYEADYGGVTMLPGGRALCVNLTGDNLGPQHPGQIDAVYANLEKRFPGARLRPGGIDVVADALWKKRAGLPVVTSEIGDTWIHGIGTDPQKTARFRMLCALRRKWIASGQLAEGGDVDLGFGEQLLLTAEHTWGMDLKTHLKNWRDYSPAAFEKAREAANFKKVERSWREQRAYLIAALRTLPADLRKEANAGLKTLKPIGLSRTSGWTSASPDESLAVGTFELGVNATAGTISQLRSRAGEGRTLSVGKKPLAALSFQTFGKADYERFYRQYIREEADWSRKDFTKPGLRATVRADVFHPSLTELERSRDGLRARLHLCFPAAAHRLGAPERAMLEVAATGEHELALRLELYGQRASRLPQALWFQLHPRLQTGAHWQLRKLGHWVDPADVVPGGNRQLHGIDGLAKGGDVTVTSSDAVLVAPEKGQLLDFNPRVPGTRGALAFNLYNNIWGTNFPMWYAGDSVFRFRLEWGNP
ncbi:DUF5054 domain-containing protein [Ruficoccus amylovorans]|uniref:DUF5054 domain-containing protein n=1 Tax=Ruficoccus amylovorans TaxID=1804625 RepID=A0A842HJ29_9BACT|nr:DUF5054 domain-containing protein [Ruficoccus amylovorans]MBC2595586.1 DUF5054 domain-containing protein [Ruficoccus amylovorans]